MLAIVTTVNGASVAQIFWCAGSVLISTGSTSVSGLVPPTGMGAQACPSVVCPRTVLACAWFIAMKLGIKLLPRRSYMFEAHCRDWTHRCWLTIRRSALLQFGAVRLGQ